MAIEIEITAREFIKPSSPTPNHLKNFKLSLLDQIAPAEYAAVLLFYCVNDNHSKATAAISKRLKTSLSETLTRFYPFAGVIKEHTSIDCNDYGVEFVDARACCLLPDILQQPDYKFLRDSLIPIDMDSPKAVSGPLVLVQTTFFKCGGVAIGICTSHKLLDGSTISTFLNSWANITLQSPRAAFPEYVAASMFPPDNSLSLVHNKDLFPAKRVTKRFLFHASKIAELKSEAASEIMAKPTRVEALTALIWKCATNASRSNRGFPRLSLLVHAVDLRKMVAPRMPESSVGNAVAYFSAQTSQREVELQGLVCHLRKAKEEFGKNGLQTILDTKRLAVIPEFDILIGRDDIDAYVFSSVSRFSAYNADFGWGKPIWVTSLGSMTKNFVMLMEAKDGQGIEALVTLSEEDMALFERDSELLQFAAFNPSVLNEAAGMVRLPSRI